MITTDNWILSRSGDINKSTVEFLFISCYNVSMKGRGNMKLNFKKLLCLLLILCLHTLATMPKVFAAIDEPKKQKLHSKKKFTMNPFTEEEFQNLTNEVIRYINRGRDINWEKIGHKLGRKADSCKKIFQNVRQ